jgi:pimeloyl-ACP methyl ester carboxylesterase
MNWLLLRGLTREVRHWGPFPRVLEERVPGARAICLDLPGAGTERARPSPWSVGGIAEDVRRRWRAAAAAGEGDWAVLGISLGGMVALEWCRRWPADFARAVLVNTSAGGTSAPLRRLQPRNLATFARIALASDLRAREGLVLAMTSRGAGDAALLAAWEAIAREAAMSAADQLRQIGAALWFRAPKALAAPALFLASTADGLVHYSCSAALAGRYRAPLALHGAAGHDLTLDDPAWVSDQVAAWLRGEGPRT